MLEMKAPKLPEGKTAKDVSLEELIAGFIAVGYSEGAASYLAGKIKGTVVDDKWIA